MIKFFRHIRQHMLAQNKFSKYLLYAIGEILLVVIGILLALQINNWNEDQILQTDIHKSLAQILSDLQQDQIELEYFNGVEAKHVSFLERIADSQGPVAGLERLLESLDHYMDFSKNNNGYSGLKNSGKISYMDNAELKLSLTHYYEKIYENLDSASNFAETFTNDRVIPFAIENLKPQGDFTIDQEIVLEKLETSNLQYLINYQISVKKYALGQVKRGIIANDHLMVLIKKELGLKEERNQVQ